MTRMVGYLALACVVIVGAAVAGFVIARDDALVLPTEGTDVPVANRDAKTDRLQTAAVAPQLEDRLRQADEFSQADDPGPAVAPVENPPLPLARPKAADLPPVQTSYTLLSDIQIAAIKERLRMSEAQARYWPPVETALRDLARRKHMARQAGSDKSAVSLSGAEAQELQAAAAPLLRQLREDQKREVRALARIIGLDAVASRI
ncbi:MAG: hypothetical protein J0H71_11380 [Rhizobiales bacterium]|nr:hypothetical protein [Hyphomicrobiales bacterium]